jgi:hypothetical protein
MSSNAGLLRNNNVAPTVPTENSVWSCKVPPGPCNNVTCLSSEPASVTFDLDVADSQAPSQR